MSTSLLIVRHGPRRGRIDGYMDRVLDGVAERSPTHRARVRVHETGGPPPCLDGVSTVLFWLADPLREWYPACYEEAVAVAGDARGRGIPVINPPECLSNSIKTRQSRLWREAGLDTPAWRRFEDPDELRDAAREVGLPLMIRADEAHSQGGVRVIRRAEQLDQLAASRLRLPGAVGPLWDTRESYRARDRRSIYARLHHKKRLYVVGDRVFTEHVFFSSYEVVSSKSCTFGRFHRLGAGLRGLARLAPRERVAIREDLDYWRRGEEHRELMVRAAATLGFGFAAIDYSSRADGSVMLWEANPHPRLPPLAKIRLPRQRLGARRLASYHRRLEDFLVGLVDGSAAAAEAGRVPASHGRRVCC